MVMAKKDNTSFTPMINQYLEVKKKNPDLIILFRLGDFYEMFFDDAILASKELQLFLTSKAAGNNQKIPMCGIPHHAYLNYVQKLLEHGHKVGIVEQLEDPKLAKGIVKRDVIQIITPGANLDIKGSDNNFLASLSDDGYLYILSLADLSTGDLLVLNVNHSLQDILSELVNYDVKELVVSTSIDASLINLIKENTKICISYYNNDKYDISYESLFTYLKDSRQVSSLSRLMNYLKDTQKRELNYFKAAKNILLNSHLKLDHSSIVNLELIRNISNENYGSLYWLLNKTKTPMGARLLKNFIIEPEADLNTITFRQNAVSCLITNFLVRSDLESELDQIYDLDRLIARVGFDSCSGKEMLQLKSSLVIVPKIKSLLASLNIDEFNYINSKLPDFSSLTDLLEKAIDVNCPNTIKEGGIFKKGYNEELDKLIELSTSANKVLLDIETRERQKTGIKTLKVGYSKIFGYYIEISNGALNQVKDEYNYIRKQTMTTGERFITSELKDIEQQILSSNQNRIDLEYKLFQELRNYLKSFTDSIQQLADNLALLDVLVSFSVVSSENRYVRPTFNLQRTIDIKDSVHPVLSKLKGNSSFVSNSYYMDNSLDVLVITGPNMGGKSTYMRQLALLVIMAQIGMFVPAKSASLYLFDAIFTRIGASDDLIKGESTFMVEMSETNRALEKATSSSLLLFDEIGRGTATYDGMALAQAIIEYIVNNIHAKTLFSTHYHEITKLVEKIPSVKNVHVGVHEENGQITFLYKLEDGAMDKSYGINVAKLALLPNQIILRASEILSKLENSKIDYQKIQETNIQKVSEKDEKDEEVIKTIKDIDPLSLTPLQALNLLCELNKKVK